METPPAAPVCATGKKGKQQMSTETTTTEATPQVQDPTAYTPEDPTTPPALGGQEAIEDAFAKEQDEAIAQVLAEAGTDDDGGDGGADDAQPEPTPDETPAAEPPAPETGKEEPPANPKPEKDAGGEDEAAKAVRLAAERTAFGKLGNRIQQQDKRIAELEALLAARGGEGKGGTEAAPKTEPQATTKETDPDAPVTDEERANILGKDWESQWGKEDADEEVKRLRRAVLQYGGGRQTPDLKKAVRAEIDAERAEAARAAAEDRIWSDLEAAVPGAGALNDAADTNGFAEWLDGIQPGTAMSRREVADHALRRIKDGATGAEYDRCRQTVVDVFKGFGAKTPAQPTTTNRGPSAKAAAIDPARYVAPGGGGGSQTAPANPAKKTYKRSAADAYLDRAQAKGEAAYQEAYDWYCRQEREGNLVD